MNLSSMMAVVQLRATRARPETASLDQSRLRRKGLYQEVYDALNRLAQTERIGKRKRKTVQQSHRRVSRDLSSLSRIARMAMDLDHVDWFRMPGPPAASELPRGPLIVKVSRHLTAVIDGVLYDTHNCSRGGMRCVYGYFSQP